MCGAPARRCVRVCVSLHTEHSLITASCESYSAQSKKFFFQCILTCRWRAAPCALPGLHAIVSVDRANQATSSGSPSRPPPFCSPHRAVLTRSHACRFMYSGFTSTLARCPEQVSPVCVCVCVCVFVLGAQITHLARLPTASFLGTAHHTWDASCASLRKWPSGWSGSVTSCHIPSWRTGRTAGPRTNRPRTFFDFQPHFRCRLHVSLCCLLRG